MDWSLFDMLLRCQPGHRRPYLRALWRRWLGPSGAIKRAVRMPRNEGKYHAQLKHRLRPMHHYESSIRLNPRGGHVFFLRGNLRHEVGDTNRAIADWRRRLFRLPPHADAKRRLVENDAAPPAKFPWPIAVGTFASVLLISLASWLGLWVLHQPADLSVSLFPFYLHDATGSDESPPEAIARARRQAEEELMARIETAGPEIERRLGQWLTAKDGVLFLHEPSDTIEPYSVHVLPATAPWRASCGTIGLSLTVAGFQRDLTDVGLDGRQCFELLTVLGQAMRSLTTIDRQPREERP
jgi:hypothetical protein